MREPRGAALTATPTVTVSADLPPQTVGICRFEGGVPTEIHLAAGLSELTTVSVVTLLFTQVLAMKERQG